MTMDNIAKINVILKGLSGCCAARTVQVVMNKLERNTSEFIKFSMLVFCFLNSHSFLSYSAGSKFNCHVTISLD